MSYFPKPSLNENDLAIIERGATAVHSIEAGQYVTWHGKTGKAKADILQGATLSDSLFDYDEDGIFNAPIFTQPVLLKANMRNDGTYTVTIPSNVKSIAIFYHWSSNAYKCFSQKVPITFINSQKLRLYVTLSGGVDNGHIEISKSGNSYSITATVIADSGATGYLDLYGFTTY